LIGYTIPIPANVTLGSSVIAINANVFQNSTLLQSIDISATGVTAIQASSFANCTALISATLPSGLLSIGNSAFSGSALVSIVIPNGVTSIGTSAFSSCTSIQSIDISLIQVTILNANTFNGNTSLLSILLPTGLTSFADETVFAGCTALTSMEIPVGMTTLPANLFTTCTALTLVSIPDTFIYADWEIIIRAAGYNGTIGTYTPPMAMFSAFQFFEPEQVPNTPTGVTAVRTGDYTITVSWNAPAETDPSVNSYYIISNNAVIRTLNAPANTTNLSLSRGSYHIAVIAINEAGQSLQSNLITVA
jgi:hypothetical protein